MWLEQEQRRRLDRLEGARHPGAGREPARPVDGRVGHRVVGVERVGVRVRDEHVGRKLADGIGHSHQSVVVHLERIVAKVEAAEARAQGLRGVLGLAVADLLDVLDRLALLLPQLSRLASLAVGESDHLGHSPLLHCHGHRAASAPHEVGGVGADHLDALAQEVRTSAGTPATRRVFSTAIKRTSSSLNPAARN